MKQKIHYLFMLLLMLLTGVGGVKAEDETITFSDRKYDNGKAVSTVDCNNFRLDISKGTWYDSGSAIRIYGGGYMKVTSKNNVILQKVEITFGSSDGSNAITTDKGTYSNGIWTGNETSIVFSIGGTSGNRRFASVKVTFKDNTPLTITLGDDNSSRTETSAGAGVELPTRNDIGAYSFLGWSETYVNPETTTKPEIIPAGNYKPVNNITLYPVYTRTETTGTPVENTASVTISEYATANKWGSSSSDNQKTIAINGDVTATCNSGSNSGKYYDDGWRIYQTETGKITISTTSGTLNSVKFTFTVSNKGTLNYNSSALTSGTAVEVSGTSAEFTVGNSGTASNGQVRITAIEVAYTTGGTSTTYYTSVPSGETPDQKVDIAALNSITPTTLNVSDKGEFSLDATFAEGTVANEDYEVSWESDNAEVLAVSGASYEAKKEGTANVTVTVTVLDDEKYNEVSKSFAVTVNDPNAPGTQNNPYTVAQARASIDAGTGLTGVYATGVVSEIVIAYNSQYGNITYNISADGTTTADQLQAYRGKSYNGDNFTSADDIQVGDVVVVYGNLKKHNSTYEFDANNQLVSLERKELADAELTFTPQEVSVILGETATVAFTKKTSADVKITNSDETVATYDAETGLITPLKYGTAIISATSDATEDFKAGEATLTIKVKNPAYDEAMFNFNDDYATLFPTLKGVSSSSSNDGDITESLTAKKDNVELTVSAKAESVSTANRIWNTFPRLRMYSGTLTISAPEYSKIKFVTFTGNEGNFDITPNSGELNGMIWEGDAEMVVFTVNKNTQIGTIEVAYETTPVVDPGTPAAITAGFYTIKNLGNGKYVNVAGRKTVTFVDETATAPGTVIKVESNEKGQVQVLRSQGVDLPGYAERAMKYVPKIVQLVAEKLGAEGEGNLLGKDGLGKIMDKFNESFDYHLYTEQGEQGVRIYGKTPSMQPVVDFYNDNKANVDAKLPMLEDFINSAIQKVLDKTGGSGASILTEFSLYEIWEKMGKTLTKPVDADSKLAFLQDVLSDKQYVWDFAYQTAMKYWKPLISHKMVQQKLSELGDLAQYVEKIEYIRPDVKYYIVQKNGKIDFISQDNTLLKEASSEWELTARETFTVQFDEQNVQKEKYYTTLYTDFAYTLPEGAKAMTVTKVAELNGKNIAITETIKGAVPAQTPVLLESATAGNVELTLEVTDGTAIENLLKGNDWLVNLLNITTPQVDNLFGIVHDLLKYENMESLYDRYVKDYEYLKKRNAGTVNNKYFFALSGDDIAEATTNICQFTKDEQGLAFRHNLEQSPANKAFLPGDKDPVYLSFVGDVNRDGKVSVADVNALVEIVLGKATEGDTHNYDFEAAHVNADEDITIADVTALVNIILK